jgi:hypothetical protein
MRNLSHTAILAAMMGMFGLMLWAHIASNAAARAKLEAAAVTDTSTSSIQSLEPVY